MLKISLLALILTFSTAVFSDDSVLEIIPLNYRPAEEVQALIVPLLEPSDRVAADGMNLIVRATPERLSEIKKLIEQLDGKLHNLLITVLQGQNISADELNASASVSVDIPINKPSSAAGEIAGQFHAAQSRGSSDNTQTLRTLEGQPAYIRTGQALPVQSVTIYNAGGYPVAANSTAMIEATTGFAVTPRLNGKEVILAVSPWSGQLQNNGTIAIQNATTNLRAKLGEWVEIGSAQQAQQFRQDGALSAIRDNRNSSLHILVKVEVID